MQYNKKKLEKYKGEIVSLRFKIKSIPYKNELSGVITAITDNHFLFLVNNDNPEIILNFPQIETISILKILKVKAQKKRMFRTIID